jgi:hypothetical protein
LISNFVRRLRGSFAAGLNLFHRRKFEWLDIRHLQLIACFDSFQFAGIELFKEVNVGVKFFRNCVGDIAVTAEISILPAQLRGSVIVQHFGGPASMTVYGTNPGSTLPRSSPRNVKRDVRVWPGLWRRGVRLFPSRFAVKRKCLPRKIIVAAVDPARAKVFAI